MPPESLPSRHDRQILHVKNSVPTKSPTTVISDTTLSRTPTPLDDPVVCGTVTTVVVTVDADPLVPVGLVTPAVVVVYVRT